MTITLSQELLQTTQMTEAEILQEIALMLYQKQRLTLEQAAQLTTMNIDDFYQLLITPNLEFIDYLSSVSLRRHFQNSNTEVLL